MTRIGQASSLTSLRASLRLGLPSKGLRLRQFKTDAHLRLTSCSRAGANTPARPSYATCEHSPANLREIFVTFADPETIGLSAVAGLLRPVGRREPFGLRVQLHPPAEAATVLRVPIAPGLIKPVGVRRYEALVADATTPLHHESGMISLDGERELHVRPGDRAEITLLPNALQTLDVGAAMRYAAQHRLLAL